MKKYEKIYIKEAEERMAKVTILKDKMNPEELALLTRMIKIEKSPFQPYKDFRVYDWNGRKNDMILWLYYNNEEFVCKLIEKNQTMYLKILTTHSTCAEISKYYYRAKVRCQS
jgi:hypothetical protein